MELKFFTFSLTRLCSLPEIDWNHVVWVYFVTDFRVCAYSQTLTDPLSIEVRPSSVQKKQSASKYTAEADPLLEKRWSPLWKV